MGVDNELDVNGEGLYHFDYSTVTGFFWQDDPATDADSFDLMATNLGLISQPYDTDALLDGISGVSSDWARFGVKLRTLNEQAPPGTTYRLLYLGRHGQGYHNIGESYYGTEAWDCYYSTFATDPHASHVRYYDAALSKLGIRQAQNLSHYLFADIENRIESVKGISRQPVTRIIPPDSFYCSPLTRAIQTAYYTFHRNAEQISSGNYHQPAISTLPPPIFNIKELLREGYGIHTCDERPSRTYLDSLATPNSPLDLVDLSLSFDPSFADSDPLWSPFLREPPIPHTARMTALLDDIFNSDASTVISLTSHSGSIAAILRAISHRPFQLSVAGMIPILVRANRRSGPRKSHIDWRDKDGWETKPECESDPLKAGREGYRDIGEFVDEIERGIDVDIDQD